MTAEELRKALLQLIPLEPMQMDELYAKFQASVGRLTPAEEGRPVPADQMMVLDALRRLKAEGQIDWSSDPTDTSPAPAIRRVWRTPTG